MSELPKIPKIPKLNEAPPPEAPEEALKDTPKIGSLDQLIKIAGEGLEGDLLGEMEEPEVKPQVKLPEIKKPAWLEEMEAAEAASQQQEADSKKRSGLALRARLAGIRERLAAKRAAKAEKSDRTKRPPAKDSAKEPINRPITKPIIKPEKQPADLPEKQSENQQEKSGEKRRKKPGTNFFKNLFSNGKRHKPSANVSEEIVFHEVDGAIEVKENGGPQAGGRKRAAKSRGRRWAGLAAALLALGLCLWLGLKLLGGGDTVMYDIGYASGYSRDPYCWEEQTPVQSDDLPSSDLQSAKFRLQAAAVEKGQAAAVQLLGDDGALLYQFANLADYDTLRGELARSYAGAEQAIWLCAEDWQKSRYNGYLDGYLLASQLLLVNTADGEQLFRGEAGSGELYLTSCGNYCYFYLPGQPERHKWLLFGRIEAEPARIVCRNIDNWAATDTVYSFAYAGRPYVTEGEERMDIDRICFSVGSEGLQVELKRYELTDAERKRWDFVAKETVIIPYLSEAEAEPEEAA